MNLRMRYTLPGHLNVGTSVQACLSPVRVGGEGLSRWEHVIRVDQRQSEVQSINVKRHPSGLHRLYLLPHRFNPSRTTQ